MGTRSTKFGIGNPPILLTNANNNLQLLQQAGI